MLQLPFTFGINTDGTVTVNSHLCFHVYYLPMKTSPSLTLALKGTTHVHTGHQWDTLCLHTSNYLANFFIQENQQNDLLSDMYRRSEQTRQNAALLAIKGRIATDINKCPTALLLLIREFISLGSKEIKCSALIQVDQTGKCSADSGHPGSSQSTILLNCFF